MLSPIAIPGLFITGTDTAVGKTVVAAAIANWFRLRGFRVGVCKPAATGCRHVREGLVSEDAELLAHCADAKAPLDVICPQRFSRPLAPAVAAAREGRTMDWETIQLALNEIAAQSDVIIVEGVGGVMVPMDQKFLLRDVIRWLELPAVVVARPGLGTINHTLLTLSALREAKIEIAGVVVNRYPVDNASVTEETNPREIEKWGKSPLLTVVPDEEFAPPHLPSGIIAAIERVDWEQFAKRQAR
ncbi:MAG TPA: dethiobiotin synthase [Tepidisphaeraceae bacterium]|jgi:dethiobiotin synthetase|nr:dethiobiotin synthase [Tepidisphaeraceae bacterium]